MDTEQKKALEDEKQTIGYELYDQLAPLQYEKVQRLVEIATLLAGVV